MPVVNLLTGTPLMMAPEVMSNSDQSSYTSKSDCWSLGMILYQLLSGLHPYSDGGEMTGTAPLLCCGIENIVFLNAQCSYVMFLHNALT